MKRNGLNGKTAEQLVARAGIEQVRRGYHLPSRPGAAVDEQTRLVIGQAQQATLRGVRRHRFNPVLPGGEWCDLR